MTACGGKPAHCNRGFPTCQVRNRLNAFRGPLIPLKLDPCTGSEAFGLRKKELSGGQIFDRQTKRFDEIWVYDDCSRDNTSEIAERYGARVVRGAVNRGCSWLSADFLESLYFLEKT